MSARQRITTTEAVIDGTRHTITLKVDGLHIRERFARQERVISFAEIVASKVAKPTRANAALATGSPAEALDIAACDLATLAMNWQQIDKASIVTVRESLSKAVKIVRSLEVVTT